MYVLLVQVPCPPRTAFVEGALTSPLHTTEAGRRWQESDNVGRVVPRWDTPGSHPDSTTETPTHKHTRAESTHGLSSELISFADPSNNGS